MQKKIERFDAKVFEVIESNERKDEWRPLQDGDIFLKADFAITLSQVKASLKRLRKAGRVVGKTDHELLRDRILSPYNRYATSNVKWFMTTVGYRRRLEQVYLRIHGRKMIGGMTGDLQRLTRCQIAALMGLADLYPDEYRKLVDAHLQSGVEPVTLSSWNQQYLQQIVTFLFANDVLQEGTFPS